MKILVICLVVATAPGARQVNGAVTAADSSRQSLVPVAVKIDSTKLWTTTQSGNRGYSERTWAEPEQAPAYSFSNPGSGLNAFSHSAVLSSAVLASPSEAVAAELTEIQQACTPGSAYWATTEGEWWAENPGPDGQLYKCTSSNTWTLYYKPFVYPLPLPGSTATETTDTTPPSVSITIVPSQ